MRPMNPDALRRWLRRYDYTVNGLARDLGVDQSTVRRWLAGTVTMPQAMDLALEALANRKTT